MAVNKELKSFDISDEAWREYDFIDRFSGERRVYRIDLPVALYIYDGCTTHRVVDAAGLVHCVPAIGCCRCVLRWQVQPGKPFVAF